LEISCQTHAPHHRHGEEEYVTPSEIRAGFKNILPTFAWKDASNVVSELSEGIIKQILNVFN
jgi:hypothetical protein